MNFFLKKEFNFKLKLLLFNFLSILGISYIYIDILESLFFRQINFIFFYKNIFDVLLTKVLISFLVSFELILGIFIIDLFYTFSSSFSKYEYVKYKSIFNILILLYLTYCIFLQKYFFESTNFFFLEMAESKFIYINKLDTVYLLYKINFSFFILSFGFFYVLYKGSLKKRSAFYFLLMCILTLISPPDIIHFIAIITSVIFFLEIFLFINYIMSVLGFEPKTT